MITILIDTSRFALCKMKLKPQAEFNTREMAPMIFYKQEFTVGMKPNANSESLKVDIMIQLDK